MSERHYNRPAPSGSPDRFDRHGSPGYLVNHVARLFARALEHRLAKHKLSRGQFPILLVLWEEQGLTQSEIARRLDIEQPTVANTLRRMKRDGLVTTCSDPQNRRLVLIGLTARGRDLKGPAIAEAHAVNAQAIAALTHPEVRQLMRILASLQSALQEE